MHPTMFQKVNLRVARALKNVKSGKLSKAAELELMN